METQRLKIMVDKLCDQSVRGCIENDWVETFIFDMKGKLKREEPMSAKQKLKIEELFEQY